MNENELHETIDRMAAAWPSEFIARKKVAEFTGFLLTGKTVANYESQKKGPPKVKCGRTSGYPKRPFVEWLKTMLFVASND